MTDLTGLYQVAENEHIDIDCFDLASREALSIMDNTGGCHIAVNPFKLTSYADEKTKLAHELGHCVTGSFYNRWASCDVRQRHENRADKWAVHHLITANDLDAAVAQGHADIWDLAEHFGVTEDFMRKAVCLYVYGNVAEDLYF